MTKQTYVILGILLVLVLAGGIFVWERKRDTTMPSIIDPAPITPAAPIVTPPIDQGSQIIQTASPLISEKWKMYRGEAVGVDLKYPDNWHIAAEHSDAIKAAVRFEAQDKRVLFNVIKFIGKPSEGVATYRLSTQKVVIDDTEAKRINGSPVKVDLPDCRGAGSFEIKVKRGATWIPRAIPELKPVYYVISGAICSGANSRIEEIINGIISTIKFTSKIQIEEAFIAEKCKNLPPVGFKITTNAGVNRVYTEEDGQLKWVSPLELEKFYSSGNHWSCIQWYEIGKEIPPDILKKLPAIATENPNPPSGWDKYSDKNFNITFLYPYDITPNVTKVNTALYISTDENLTSETKQRWPLSIIEGRRSWVSSPIENIERIVIDGGEILFITSLDKNNTILWAPIPRKNMILYWRFAPDDADIIRDKKTFIQLLSSMKFFYDPSIISRAKIAYLKSEGITPAGQISKNLSTSGERDNKRINELLNLRTALMLYYADNNFYPPTNEFYESLFPTYIPAEPVDPMSSKPSNNCLPFTPNVPSSTTDFAAGDYGYAYKTIPSHCAKNCTGYLLQVCLENPIDILSLPDTDTTNGRIYDIKGESLDLF